LTDALARPGIGNVVAVVAVAAASVMLLLLIRWYAHRRLTRSAGEDGDDSR
jgi:hypothetical protein